MMLAIFGKKLQLTFSIQTFYVYDKRGIEPYYDLTFVGSFPVVQFVCVIFSLYPLAFNAGFLRACIMIFSLSSEIFVNPLANENDFLRKFLVIELEKFAFTFVLETTQ